MKSRLTVFVLFIFTMSMFAQEFVNGTIITQRYDTIANVKIKKVNDAKSLLHVTYIDHKGTEQKPDIELIKCYTRGEEIYCRIYYSGEMIFVKQLIAGTKLNLYKKVIGGSKIYFIEKVYDELIKVPGGKGKFAKVISSFLNNDIDIASKIKSKELFDIEEIVNLYNKG